jgi:outer membrane protein
MADAILESRPNNSTPDSSRLVADHRACFQSGATRSVEWRESRLIALQSIRLVHPSHTRAAEPAALRNTSDWWRLKLERPLRRLRPFIAMTGCLLAFLGGATRQTAHAQVEVTTASSDQKTDARKPSGDEPETGSVSGSQTLGSPFKQSRWFTRLGVLVVPYHSSATIAANGQVVSGGTAKASNNMTVTFDFGYEITRNISVSVTSGIPPKPHITGEGAVANLAVLGKVRYGPAFFTGYYRFPATGRFRPYVGGGAAYAIIFKEFDGSVKQLEVHNNWGAVLQGGAEYELNSKYTVFVDFKEVWLAVNAHGVLSDGSPVKARVKLNPSLITVGIKFHLPFGRGH